MEKNECEYEREREKIEFEFECEFGPWDIYFGNLAN